jgi:hypothetical protein
MFTIALAATLATAALSLTVQTASAQARSPVLKMMWGPVFLPSGNSAFPIYHRLGVNVFEIELVWDRVALSRPAQPTNPNDPAYQWPSELDLAVHEASLYGIKLSVLVQRSPGWANGGQPDYWEPNNPSDYANFLIAAARRYPSVHHWMIWGEPTLPGNFAPMPANSPVGPEHYAVLLNAAYNALKSVSRKNIVIGGDTFTAGLVTPEDFIKWMRLPNGKPPPLDYYGHDPYSRPPRFPNLREQPYSPGIRDLNDIDTLEAQLQHTYHRLVKLWLAEWSIPSDSPSFAFSFYVSRKDQARWLRAAFRLVNSVDYVAGFGWFTLLDGSPSIPGHLTNGLMTWDVHPKPAYYAYKRAR